MIKSKIVKFIISILIPQISGGIGSIATSLSVGTWYKILEKPWFNPPSFVFAPVWTLLFLCIGVALYLVWSKNNKDEEIYKIGIYIFSGQMILNIIWSYLFFGLRNPGVAFFEMIVLLIFIILNVIFFFKINKLAGYLMIPYILWVCFALVLNFSIWRLN